MYDDYDYKLTNKRIRFQFIQKEDSYTYPWEIARFIGDLNKNYYKFEILNSISTALINGVNPQDIIILNRSLPLNNNYTDLNTIDALNDGLSFIYSIGEMNSLSPSKQIHELSEALKLFYAFNSALHKAKFKPLSLKRTSHLYEAIKNNGIEIATKTMLDLVATRETKEKKLPNFEKIITGFNSKISYIKAQYDLATTVDIDNVDKRDPKTFPNGLSKNFFSKFKLWFNKLHRPVVLIKEGDEFRVLARGLVNKQSLKTKGLELRSMPRNSPLRAMFEAGINAYGAVNSEKRLKELHEKEKEIKSLELTDKLEELEHNRKLRANQLKQEELRTQREMIVTQINIEQELKILANLSDVNNYKRLGSSHHEQLIKGTYEDIKNQTSITISEKGFSLEPEKTLAIDVKV